MVKTVQANKLVRGDIVVSHGTPRTITEAKPSGTGVYILVQYNNWIKVLYLKNEPVDIVV